MRNFSLLGLLIAVAIIGYWAKSMFVPAAASHDPNDRATVEYWTSHEANRTAMLSWCNSHPDQQSSQDCKLAIAAQTQIDANGATHTSSQGGVDQTTSGAQDQLQAQKDANLLP
ncbi:MAG: hypothetical protein M3Z37_03305 [Candidatus Eremiobacteraeota bacterium]|nr:hypothetical protein [Candidatus Eremiobacteraeota bacterium]